MKERVINKLQMFLFRNAYYLISVILKMVKNFRQRFVSIVVQEIFNFLKCHWQWQGNFRQRLQISLHLLCVLNRQRRRFKRLRYIQLLLYSNIRDILHSKCTFRQFYSSHTCEITVPWSSSRIKLIFEHIFFQSVSLISSEFTSKIEAKFTAVTALMMMFTLRSLWQNIGWKPGKKSRTYMVLMQLTCQHVKTDENAFGKEQEYRESSSHRSQNQLSAISRETDHTFNAYVKNRGTKT